MTLSQRLAKRDRAQLSATLRNVFAPAHDEGRAVMTHEEFLLAASVAGLSEAEVLEALSEEIIRKGLTGFWIKEAADPGALLVFANAMIDTMREAA